MWEAIVFAMTVLPSTADHVQELLAAAERVKVAARLLRWERRRLEDLLREIEAREGA
jgi:hypothetical protein